MNRTLSGRSPAKAAGETGYNIITSPHTTIILANGKEAQTLCDGQFRECNHDDSVVALVDLEILNPNSCWKSGSILLDDRID